MLTLDLNEKIKDLKGNVIEGENNTLAAILAQLLGGASDVGPDTRKFLRIAEDLENTGKAQVDKPDLDKVFKFVDAHKGLTVLAKGRLLDAIEAAEKTAQ